MGNNASAAVDELSEELAALLETTTISSDRIKTRDELYSFFDDGFDDDAEEIPEATGAKTPAPMEKFSQQSYFALPRSLMTPEVSLDCMEMTAAFGKEECQEYSRVPQVMDEGYYSSECEDLEMDCGDEEEKEALLPAKRFSWRASSPERCSLLYWEK